MDNEALQYIGKQEDRDKRETANRTKHEKCQSEATAFFYELAPNYKGIPILLAVDFGIVLFWGRFSRVTHQAEAHVLQANLDALAEAGYLITEAADVVDHTTEVAIRREASLRFGTNMEPVLRSNVGASR